MSVFQRKNHQRIYEGAVSIAIVLSLFLATMTPQAVRADVEDVLFPVTSALQKLSEETLLGQTQPASGFPVANDRVPVKIVRAVATAYNSDVRQTDSTPCITANGFDLCAFYQEKGYGNTIAANFLPMGAQVRFPELFGDKVFIVRDRMNARYGYGRVDVWMPEHAEAKTFGAKYTKMEIF